MHNERKIVLFDIDYTVFNTDKYLHSLHTTFAQVLSIPQDEAEELVKQAIANTRKVKQHFDPQMFLSEVSHLANKSDIQHALSDVFWNKAMYSQAIYAEVTAVIRTLREEGIEVGILSTGNDRHQRQKIETLAEFFAQENIHIFVNKLLELEKVITKYASFMIFIVDDLEEVLATAKHRDKSIITVQIRKPKNYEIADKHGTIKPDFIVESLEEIISIVLKS
jgi:phosphoglycolate phosphatase-like HAD superfamily hydrolase